jgi:hypothetical protein
MAILHCQLSCVCITAIRPLLTPFILIHFQLQSIVMLAICRRCRRCLLA